MVQEVNNGREPALRHPISRTALPAADRTKVVSALALSRASKDVLAASSSHNSKLPGRVLSILAVGSVEAVAVRNSKANKARVTLRAETKVNSTRTSQGTKADIGNDRYITTGPRSQSRLSLCYILS